MSCPNGNIITYLESKGIKVKNGRSNCPFCHGDNSQKLAIYEHKFKCYKCGAWGDLADLQRHYNEQPTKVQFTPRVRTPKEIYRDERLKMLQRTDDYAEWWLNEYDCFGKWEIDHV